jgi:alkaline phosphatase
MNNFTKLVALPLCLVAVAPAEAGTAKNVILMIADGAGPTTWLAANQFQFGGLAETAPEFMQRFQQADFSQHWMATYSGHNMPLPPGQSDVRLGLQPGSLPNILPQLWNELPIPKFGSYDPTKANDTTIGDVRVWANSSGSLLGDRGPRVDLTPVAGNSPTLQFLANNLEASGQVRAHLDSGPVAYDYLIWDSITDSAAAGSALASGIRTYNSSINYTLDGQPVPFLTQQVKDLGKRAGVVTTKPFTDATPAVFGTQDDFRDDELAISDAMIRNGLLDVIITPGHPEFGGGGVPRTPNFSTISSANLAGLRDGSLGWTLVETTDGLVDIANGTVAAPDKLFGLVPVSSALNSRNTAGQTNAFDPTIHDPENPPAGVVPFVMPDLAVLADAAINSLKNDPDGFFLLVEGASVDSAAHANNLAQLVEEQLAFNRAVDAVIDWVETESSWEETLLIVTTDHANGLFLGPDSDTIAFQDPIAQGVGQLPLGIFWTTNHTNELVPLWTKGAGSDLFSGLSEGFDPRRGNYFHISDVNTVMSSAIQPVPVPAAAWLFGSAAIGLLGARRKAA